VLFPFIDLNSLHDPAGARRMCRTVYGQTSASSSLRPPQPRTDSREELEIIKEIIILRILILR